MIVTAMGIGTKESAKAGETPSAMRVTSSQHRSLDAHLNSSLA
jgi:hypothetical protein